MKWVIGIDEAGYGPNLGPFVTCAVVCRVSDQAHSCLWERLGTVVKRARPAAKKGDTRLVVDDSKLVRGSKGMVGLERGTLPFFATVPSSLAELVSLVCPSDGEELSCEPWYTGQTTVPHEPNRQSLAGLREELAECCRQVGLAEWGFFGVVVCPQRFNRLVERAGTKSAVLADSFVRLLSAALPACGEGDVEAFIDKQGGRNSYRLQVQQATGGLVRVLEEGEEASRYVAEVGGQQLTVTFQARADGAHLPVALASMLSKYLRELFMGELNAFWGGHVAGLAPTAGYPGDAGRYLEQIRPSAARLGIAEESIWRKK